MLAAQEVSEAVRAVRPYQALCLAPAVLVPMVPGCWVGEVLSWESCH